MCVRACVCVCVGGRLHAIDGTNGQASSVPFPFSLPEKHLIHLAKVERAVGRVGWRVWELEPRDQQAVQLHLWSDWRQAARTALLQKELQIRRGYVPARAVAAATATAAFTATCSSSSSVDD